ncbi:MAG: hypothetical protein JNM17_18715 [Archangium sp.]|nr:hypothetical protein [Archangium sp.]
MDPLVIALLVILGSGVAFPFIYTFTRPKPKPDRFRDPLRSLVPVEKLLETDGGVQLAVTMPPRTSGEASIEVLLQNCFDSPRSVVIDWRAQSGLEPAELHLRRHEQSLAPLETGRLLIPFGPTESRQAVVPTTVVMVLTIPVQGGTRLRWAKGAYVAAEVSANVQKFMGLTAIAGHGFARSPGIPLSVEVEGGAVPRREPTWERIWAPDAKEIAAALQQP